MSAFIPDNVEIRPDRFAELIRAELIVEQVKLALKATPSYVRSETLNVILLNAEKEGEPDAE